MAAALAAGLWAQQEPRIRVDVRLVRLLVTVKDNQGKFAGSLTKDDFQITDNGVKQDVAVFEKHNAVPLSVAVLIDASGSTAKDLKVELDSTRRFLKAFYGEGNAKDMAALYSFNWEVVKQMGFTRNFARMDEALRRLKGEAGTSLYDAIYYGAQALEDRDGRHVIIVVTDGGDTTSSKKFHDALEAAHRADAVIYSIVVVPITNGAGRNTGGENALFTLGQATGGRVFAPSVGPDLDRAFGEILADLRTQYMLGYYPRNIPATKDRFHKLSLTMRDKGLHAQTRTGYYGDSYQ